MSCNGYHTLNWYYTYPMHPYRPVSIRKPRPDFVLVEYQIVSPPTQSSTNTRQKSSKK